MSVRVFEISAGYTAITGVFRSMLGIAVLVTALLATVIPQTHAAEPATAQDIARLLAGMPVTRGSPLISATQSPGWIRHAAEMNTAWEAFENNHLRQTRDWSKTHLPVPYPAMFYMFGGPDFVHADAFYPNAATYVLSGLEPVGRVPKLAAVSPEKLEEALGALRQSLKNFMQYGYFITREMDQQLRAGQFKGTLPVLLVFLARTGKTIHKVNSVHLNTTGTVQNGWRKGRPGGAKLVFSGSDGNARTLYYFRTNLANGGVRTSGFLKFCARLGRGGSLVKSASYLMHTKPFSKVRDFLLQHSAAIVQDDSGIPLKHFTDKDWAMKPFGRYLGPTDQFKRFQQADLADFFAAGGAKPVDFGIGYRWHPQRTNILLAKRREPVAPIDPRQKPQ